ncbi:hypothetical protein BWR59_17030 [Pseudomonas sp. Bc-h]|uniref:hypothetical protein n=1 Tax=Pseudomonas sp. Bc-h TaxID=1943632 RepID=UPI0009DB47CA|nr:hypothetical protein [Pseudomonas sp. Bc-h]OQR30263.1 hypothetical protein BWR59_17030 [Pseudomonas sp. Bc-h]
MATDTEEKKAAARRAVAKPEDEPMSRSGGEQAVTTVEVFPLRSYQDDGEIKRRGGPGYSVPKRHADQLILAGLATDKNPKA